MRSRKNLMLLGVTVLVCSAVAFWGCGSDDDNPVNYGSLEDPEFNVVDNQVAQLLDSTMANFTEGLGAIVNLPTDDPTDPVHYGPDDPNAETDSLSVSYNGGWHVIYLSYHHSNGYSALVEDSVQFLVQGDPVQNPDGLDALRYRHRWMWQADDTTVTHAAFDGNSSFDFANLNTEVANINGTNSQHTYFKFVSADSVVSREMNIEMTVNDFEISKTAVGWAQGCPNSGTAEVNVTMVYQKDNGDPVESTWTFHFSFNNGSLNASVTDGNQTWTYTRQECTPPSA